VVGDGGGRGFILAFANLASANDSAVIYRALCQIGHPRGARVPGCAGHIKRFIFFFCLTRPWSRDRTTDLNRKHKKTPDASIRGFILWAGIV